MDANLREGPCTLQSYRVVKDPVPETRSEPRQPDSIIYRPGTAICESICRRLKSPFAFFAFHSISLRCHELLIALVSRKILSWHAPIHCSDPVQTQILENYPIALWQPWLQASAIASSARLWSRRKIAIIVRERLREIQEFKLGKPRGASNSWSSASCLSKRQNCSFSPGIWECGCRMNYGDL